MENSDIGESSCRRKPNIDKMSDSERPLKKAKFAWQVKGRYHLKDQEEVSENNLQENNTQITPAPNIVNVEQIESITEGIEMTSKAEENLELLGDYLLRQQDFSIAPIINTTSESSASEVKPLIIPQEEISGPSSEIMTAAVSLESPSEVNVPVNNCAFNKGLAQCSAFKSFADDFMYARPLPIIVQQKQLKTEDQYLARWQARQIAKGFVDNTINRVLDSWLVAPLPTAHGDSHNIAIDVAEFFDNLPANNAVENEGILMAISAHGLQNNLSGCQGNDCRLQNRSFSSRICTIGLSGPNSQSDDQNSPNRDSSSAQYIFSSDVDENDQGIFSMCKGTYLGNSSSFYQSTNLPNNENDSLSFNYSSNKDNSDSAKSCKSAESSDKCNEMPSSSDPSVWRHLTEPCNCSHTPRRTNITPNIPFHRRDNIDHLSNPAPILEECISVEEEVSAGSLSTIESKKEDCLTDDKSSDDSANEEECQNSNNQSSSSVFPMTEPSDQPFDETFDFMEAAVAFAIQNKGLTSFSSVDYG